MKKTHGHCEESANGGRRSNLTRSVILRRSRRISSLARDDMTNGFTLLETIIALAVVLVGVVGSLTLAAQSVRGGRASTNEIIAQNLAREGIEVAYAIRDSNWMAIESGAKPADQWDDGLYGAPSDYTSRAVLNASGNWSLDYTVNNACDNGCELYLNETTGVYSHDSTGTPTSFRRGVATHPICDNGGDGVIIALNTCEGKNARWKKIGVRVLVTVTWEDQGTGQMLQLEDRLYDWRQ
ncbi:MAG: prepilin-type N-terminal cleavage/methylation domain-containing protein [Candidatus Kerfeldbacteria bacterium]|nr:prepilin-type N-terminal cleavage/methylation domain-containing protein [Candidatus Kerfeldbacteria bacterium]